MSAQADFVSDSGRILLSAQDVTMKVKSVVRDDA